jgi:hypothetical protein
MRRLLYSTNVKYTKQAEYSGKVKAGIGGYI